MAPGGGEDPVVERYFFGQFLGLLGHGLQFVEQYLGVELAGDLRPEFVNGSGDHLVFRLLKELAQGPSPV